MKKLTPVLLGGDLNAYSMATAFAEYNGSKSHVFAREKLAMTDSSSYITLHVTEGLDDPDFAVPALLRFAMEHKGENLILIPCADWYMEMLEYARDALEGHFYFFIPDFEVWKTTSDKSTFIKILAKYEIPYPKTAVFDSSLKSFLKEGMKLRPPFVLKPSNSSEYWKNPFEDMQKVYFTDSLDESLAIAKKIFKSGYGDKVLLQERIGRGKEPSASVLTTYSNKNGEVVRAVLADVLLEECGPTARGNYSALITRQLDKISYRIMDMLEGIKYKGIANFDILYAGENAFLLELNPRQGRSFDYIRGAGVSIPELLYAEYGGEVLAPKFTYEDSLWRAVSKKTLIRHSKDKGLLKKAMILEKNGKSISPYDFKGDRNIQRVLYVLTHLYREGRRYKKHERAESI